MSDRLLNRPLVRVPFCIDFGLVEDGVDRDQLLYAEGATTAAAPLEAGQHWFHGQARMSIDEIKVLR
jgi:hypothetical protein